MAEILLKLDGIVKDFPGTRALDHVQLVVEYGQVHAVIGENGAGKSTLMNIIAGVFPQTEGTITFEGETVQFAHTIDAQKRGIAIVHQEINLCPHVSVAENIFLGRAPKKGGMVDYKKMEAESADLLKSMNSTIDPRKKVQDLSIAEQQIVEIVKALSMNCKLLILDEPTSSLTEVETAELFKTIRHLKSQGISILYISHRLSEIMDICDHVTVFRDGQYIGTDSITNITTDDLVSMMVGRKLESIYPEKAKKISEDVILEAENYSGDMFQNVSFQLRRGEILGFSGLVGAGRSEMARALCGIDRKTDGSLTFKGEALKIRNYRESIDRGIVYITENRKEDGLFLDYNIRQNITATCLDQLKNGFALSRAKEDSLAQVYVEKIKIKVFSLEQLCSALSGGNQQKVLFAKWLTVDPKVLIIDEPTRGIDVGVRLEIYRILRQLCEDGVGVIVISSDLPEVLGICDRVVVMAEGRVTGELSADEMTEEAVMRLASV